MAAANSLAGCCVLFRKEARLGACGFFRSLSFCPDGWDGSVQHGAMCSFHISMQHAVARHDLRDIHSYVRQIKAQAQSFANALSTIGKFVLRKKTGERDQIYGSVQVQEIADVSTSIAC